MFSKESVGVEIAATHLKIAHAKATPFDTAICAHAEYDLDAGAGFGEKLATVKAKVKDFLRRHRIGSACLWIGLPQEMVIQRLIRLPSAAKENLVKSIEYELPKYIPMAPEDIYFHYQILAEDRDERHLTLLVAAVKKKDLTPLIELRDDLNAGICGVESAATAGINGLKWASETLCEKNYALAYLADGALHLSCFEEDHLRFIHTLNPNHDLVPQFERIFQERDGFWPRDAESGGAPEVNVYCHGPDATDELLTALNHTPHLAFSLLDPSQGPLEDNPPPAVAGLALKSLQRAAVDINLFPEQFRKKPSVIGRYATLALVVLTLISGMAWAGSHIMHQRMADQRIGAELHELADEIDALGQAQSQIATLQQQIDALDDLRRHRIQTLELLKELTKILPETAWLFGLSIADNRLEIQGYADSSTQLIPQLEASPLFANARYISTITKARDGKQVFKIGSDIISQEKDRGK